MKQFIYTIFILLVVFASCSKVVDSTTNTSTTSGTTTGTANIKFYNVMDYGNVNISLAGSSVGDVAIYYSTTYRSVTAGSTNIKIFFGGSSVLDVYADLLGGKNYSCFIYRVGFNWRVSIVTDDLTAPAAGKAGVRVLDFRTQAYFNYVKIKFISPGTDVLDYVNRNFLDHLSFDTYTTFKQINAGTYNINVFNDSATLSSKKDIAIGTGKIYSLIMMTPADLTAAAAINYINLDFSTLK